MKKFFMIIALAVSSLIILGCSSPISSTIMAKDIVTQYKGQLYNIPEYSKSDKVFSDMDEVVKYIDGFKGYMTEEGYKRFGANRIGTMPLEACNKGKFNLKMSRIEFKKVTEESNKIILEYEVNLEAFYPETQRTEKLVETGETALIKENSTWKIDHDWFRVVDLFKQELKRGQGAIAKF